VVQVVAVFREAMVRKVPKKSDPPEKKKASTKKARNKKQQEKVEYDPTQPDKPFPNTYKLFGKFQGKDHSTGQYLVTFLWMTRHMLFKKISE